MQYHIILVTKYRRPAIYGDVEKIIKSQIHEVVEKSFEGQVIEMESDKDHIHVLVSIGPKYALMDVVAVMKGRTSREVRSQCWDQVKKQLWGDHFWSPSYYVATTGGVTIETLKQYVQSQPEKPRKAGRPKLTK